MIRNSEIIQDSFSLTEEHRMLLQMRDSLYEGCWEDFIRDLEARAFGKPHVYETVPTSDQMKSTIKNHLLMIANMVAWEQQHDTSLTAIATR